MESTMEKQALGPNQQKWLAALRSGEFKQNHIGQLRTDKDEFCCLGVAAEILGAEKFCLGRFYTYGSQNATGALTREICEEIGLRAGLGDPRDPTKPCLSTYNDNGSTFAEIADIIEADPAQYFTEPR